MTDVYLIGNGFDLNLGLKTSYRDFVGSQFFKRHVDGHSELFNYLNQVNEMSNWIDIERELAEFSRKSDHSPNLLDDYKKLCGALKEYIKSIDIASVNTESDAYKLFSEKNLDDIIVVNFNYTDSVSYILKSLGYGDSLQDRILHVHGSVNQDEIIFGVDDNAKINDTHTFLYKSTSPLFDGRRCFEAFKKFDSLHIFGHSLGEPDHMYFGFLNSLKSPRKPEDNYKSINIYHYGEEAKYNVYKQLHTLTSNHVSHLKSKTLFKDVELTV
ncbi:AbiH family protein [Catenovulum agarivorans]|uniref:AbiH family protein n=1 Tax=Catenovulum agarivorans TaxID=1172192 RepID=UPI0003157C64|nr:AbiH family protein [Catenovulum agarivorans]